MPSVKGASPLQGGHDGFLSFGEGEQDEKHCFTIMLMVKMPLQSQIDDGCECSKPMMAELDGRSDDP